MDRLIKHFEFHSSFCDFVEYGKGDSVPIDQQSAQPFNIDVLTGRPVNDITAVLRSQDKFEQQRVLANLEQFKATYLPDDVSNDDVVKYAVPRYAQLPSELAEVAEKFTQQKLDEAEKAVVKKKEAELNKLVEAARNKVKDTLDD